MKHLIGDIAPELPVRKSIFLPYVSRERLRRVLSSDRQLEQVHTRARARARTHARTHTHIRTHARMHKHARTSTHARTRTHTRARARTHKNTRTHAHARANNYNKTGLLNDVHCDVDTVFLQTSSSTMHTRGHTVINTGFRTDHASR